MFGKLIKHEFRATARIIPFVFLVTVFLALVHIVTGKLNLGAASRVSLVLMIIMSFAQIAISFVLVIWRYDKNLYSNEAYLTHSLPVHPSELLWSKCIVGFVWVALSYIVGAAVFAGVMIADFVKSADQLSAIFKGFQALLAQTGLEDHQGILWAVIAVLLALSIGMLLAQAYFAITAGNLSKLHKLGVGGPLLVFFAEYIVLQFVGAFATLFIPLGLRVSAAGNALPEFKLVTQNMFSQISKTIYQSGLTGMGSEAGIIGIGYYILMPVIVIGLLYWTSRIITRHTSVK